MTRVRIAVGAAVVLVALAIGAFALRGTSDDTEVNEDSTYRASAAVCDWLLEVDVTRPGSALADADEAFADMPNTARENFEDFEARIGSGDPGLDTEQSLLWGAYC